ncbi:MAG: glycosyltransferase family 2 protein [Ignavibacteriae bacterium]|nr:MAG: glycosyltransferase family 2 protein [Ignavibacteriota bacterium]
MSAGIKQITVLMPAYNCAKYIKASIKSILNQTYKDFELLIVDDGSTDNTCEIVESFKDERIIYKKTEHKGTAAALNYGLDNASGDWIARIDADDLNVPVRLEKQVKFLNANPDYDVISSWSVYFNDKNRILFPLREPIIHEDIVLNLNLHNPLNQSGVMYNKELIKKERYDESFLLYEDYELFYRLRNKVKFYNIAEFLVYTRVRKDAKSSALKDEKIYEMLFNNAFKKLINSSNSKGEAFYWTSNIAWINYFFGDKKDARKYLYHSFSMKNILAYAATFLPENLFQKLLRLRLKYRINAIKENKKKFKEELKRLLKD